MKSKLYFIEKTVNIDGFYLESEILYISKDKNEALSNFDNMTVNISGLNNGLTLNEYIIESSSGKIKKLIKSFSKLPITFFKYLKILNFKPLKEFQPI